MKEFKNMCSQIVKMCCAFYALTRAAEKTLIHIATEVEKKN